jgi:succinate dehydrogenase/fumarate reductase-like Fe-S protein
METDVLVVGGGGACQTRIQEDITLEPLSKSGIIKDLVVGQAMEGQE